MNIENDYNFMEQAIALAKRATGQTSPNPLVGAILVKDDTVIGGGYHKKAGDFHAEPNAIKDAQSRGYDVSGSTLYCTLEPCCHTDKRTPPCTQLIINKKIKRVVIGCLDPNPKVAGKGVKELKNAGIDVEFNVMQSECEELITIFRKYILTNCCYVHLKLAMTLDGRICSAGGDSKWISNESSRKRVHELRCKYDAVLIGRNTLELDNPSLTIRMGVFCHNKVPWKIILADGSKLNFKLPFFQTDSEKIVIAHTGDPIFKCDFQTVQFSSWDQFLSDITKLDITSILVEGGAKVSSTLIDEGMCDEISLFMAPKLIGNGPSIYNSDKSKAISDAISLENFNFELMEGDNRCIHWHWKKV